mgnify:CR=1 FL=1
MKRSIKNISAQSNVYAELHPPIKKTKNIRMKRIFYSLFLLAAISLGSCKKLLNTVPSNFLAPANYFNTAADLDAALTGVYDYLYTIYGTNWLYRYGMEADEGYYRSTTLADILFLNTHTPATAGLLSLYQALWIGVSRANYLLANVDKNPEIAQDIRGRIRGEALFLRAHYYSMLVRMFGGVPLVLEPVASPDEVHVPRATAQEVYDQIIKDMTEAEGLVADIQSLGYGGRVNKSAVRGMLARVFLFMAGEPLKDVSKYEQARTWAKKIIDEGFHDLNPSYSDIFIKYARDEYDIKESIWEVEYWGNRFGAYSETGQNGGVNGPSSANAETGVAVGGLFGTKYLWDLYQSGDLRKSWSMVNFTYNATGANGAKTFVPENRSPYERAAGKARREYEMVTPKSAQWTPTNYPMLRYADILLMFAEAENEINGPTAAAINAINAVRRRAWSTGIKFVTITDGGSGYTVAPTVSFSGGGGSGAVATATISGGAVTGIVFALDAVTGRAFGEGYASPPEVILSGGDGSGATAEAEIFIKDEADLSPAQTASKEAFRKAIQEERAQELCFEGLRKHDLIRWGIFVDRMQQIGVQIETDIPTAAGANYATRYKSVLDKHVIYPIPELELTRNNKLVQNPGWE